MVEPTKDKQPQNNEADLKRRDADAKPNAPANDAAAQPEADEAQE